MAYTDLDIEHIIPESAASTREDWEVVKRDYGLPGSFDINSLENLVPAHHRPCNLNKGGRNFAPGRARYFLEMADAKQAKVRQYLAAIALEGQKENVLAAIAFAIDTAGITISEIEATLAEKGTFTLGAYQDFIDDSGSGVLKRQEIETLLDRPVFPDHPGECGTKFINRLGQSMMVRTCREYRAALAGGFFPKTSLDISDAARFTAINAALAAVSRAKLALVSYINDPYCGVADLHLLPGALLKLNATNPSFTHEDMEAASLSDVAKEGRLRLVDVSSKRLHFEWCHSGAVISELLRADLDDDGIEEILFDHYMYVTEGTLRYGSVGVLRRGGSDQNFTFELFQPA